MGRGRSAAGRLRSLGVGLAAASCSTVLNASILENFFANDRPVFSTLSAFIVTVFQRTPDRLSSGSGVRSAKPSVGVISPPTWVTSSGTWASA